MIVAIGEWVLNTAVHDAKRWLDLQLPLAGGVGQPVGGAVPPPQLPEMVTLPATSRTACAPAGVELTGGLR